MVSFIPEHSSLKNLEPLGWIHTQPSETGGLAATDATMHAKLQSIHSNWDATNSVIGTCSFTQGSCSLSMYRLTPQGLEWALKNQKETAQDMAITGFDQANYERV